MKAFLSWDNKNDSQKICVYAENHGKARSEVWHKGVFGKIDYTRIRVQRIPEFDKFYSGESFADVGVLKGKEL